MQWLLLTRVEGVCLYQPAIPTLLPTPHSQIYWCVFVKSRHGYQTPYVFFLLCVEWFDVRGEFSFFLNGGIVEHHCLNLFSNSNKLIIFHTCSTGTFYISRLISTRRTFTRNRITWMVDTLASAGAFISKHHWCTRYKQEL